MVHFIHSDDPPFCVKTTVQWCSECLPFLKLWLLFLTSHNLKFLLVILVVGKPTEQNVITHILFALNPFTSPFTIEPGAKGLKKISSEGEVHFLFLQTPHKIFTNPYGHTLYVLRSQINTPGLLLHDVSSSSEFPWLQLHIDIPSFSSPCYISFW